MILQSYPWAYRKYLQYTTVGPSLQQIAEQPLNFMRIIPCKCVGLGSQYDVFCLGNGEIVGKALISFLRLTNHLGFRKLGMMP